MSLFRYPVKGMAGEVLEAAEVSWHGVEGDRRWSFVRPGLERSDFPWLTIRERSGLASYVVGTEGTVRTPGGAELAVDDPALAAELGEGVTLIKQNRGVFDAAPLSLISRATVETLCAQAGVAPDVRRFRPNLVVDGVEAFAEDAWVGRELRIGGMTMRVDRRDERCVVTNVDPDSGARNPAVLRAIAQGHNACLGVYGTTVTPGRVAVGDPVALA